MRDPVAGLSMLNDAAVSVFGGFLSAAFCNALRTPRSRRIFWFGMALMLIPQGWVYLNGGAALLVKIYPLVTHLPLLVLLCILTRRLLWPTVAILSAYLFCQLRRWLGLLVQFVLHGGVLMQETAELLFTVPLLLLLLYFVAPAVSRLSEYPVHVQGQFGIIPAMYYGFDYLTRIYTDLLTSGSPVVVEFMPTICCVAYLFFLLYNSAEDAKRSQLRQVQSNLEIQMSQAMHEISALRESQAVAARHRHDLRHHLQYLSACIENGQDDRAKAYISALFREIESEKVQQYCENEAANLILSSFVGRAKAMGIEIQVQGTLPAVISVLDNDLCVILSNALENALRACQDVAEGKETCVIQVQFEFHRRGGRVFLQISNPCGDDVRFEKGLPVSDRPGHGLGVQSIRTIVERYGGACKFWVQDGRFYLRLFL